MGGQPSKRISMSVQPEGDGVSVQVTEDFLDDLITSRPELEDHANKLKLATEVYQNDLQGRLGRQEEIFREFLTTREHEREEHQTSSLQHYIDQLNLRFRSRVSEPLCQDQAGEVQRCLLATPDRPLDCNPLVQDFLACSQSAYKAYRQAENAD